MIARLIVRVADDKVEDGEISQFDLLALHLQGVKTVLRNEDKVVFVFLDQQLTAEDMEQYVTKWSERNDEDSLFGSESSSESGSKEEDGEASQPGQSSRPVA